MSEEKKSPTHPSARKSDRVHHQQDVDWDSEEDEGASGFSEMDALREMLARKLELGSASGHERVLEELTLGGVAKHILAGKCKNIVCMVGAGISTAAGIPDFRSPGTGLYDNLQKYNLPHPQAVFDIGYFRENPEPFFALAKELYPGQFKPTVSHYFIRLLKDKECLLRCYTQNIDTLERVAGLENNELVEAHGTFHTSHCLGCRHEYCLSWMKEQIFSDKVPRCEKCKSVVKPDIVFFGEALPEKFFTCVQSDFPKCDLLIIMGTSLVVQPFASLTSRVPDSTPRLLINLEKSGQCDPMLAALGLGSGFDFDSDDAYRDVAWLGTCDDGCLEFAELLGWKDELNALVKAEHTRIEAESGTTGDTVGAGVGVSTEGGAAGDGAGASTVGDTTGPGTGASPEPTSSPSKI
ncbi:NAD-dependent protein deacetylase sirtuin-2 [Petromyzon marinus]|uniref:NAD-dependent protein deacetylase sirtuin-2 n=1 Tax=Petromyzon marinus TaxID=7757 RepID=UPI003F6EF71B